MSSTIKNNDNEPKIMTQKTINLFTGNANSKNIRFLQQQDQDRNGNNETNLCHTRCSGEETIENSSAVNSNIEDALFSSYIKINGLRPEGNEKGRALNKSTRKHYYNTSVFNVLQYTNSCLSR